jgi:hypothetical protein
MQFKTLEYENTYAVENDSKRPISTIPNDIIVNLAALPREMVPEAISKAVRFDLRSQVRV